MAAGSDANTHGHMQNGTPEVRTTTVMRSMHSRAPTHGRPELEPPIPRPTRGLRAPGPASVAPTEGSRTKQPLLTGEGEVEAVPVARLPVALAGICGDEAADDTFP